MNADAVTVNPYMGLDSVEPFFRAAEAGGRGVAVLVRTSNPGARDFQDLMIAGRPLWAEVAAGLVPIERRLLGASGWSNLMIVAGATAPDEARALRNILPRTLFLVPGYGAQGATAAEAMAGLPGGLGGVVNASRAALYPDGAAAAASITAWERCMTDGLARLADELRAVGMTA
jgi:orotidine-5'-phosphate decarboxylase